MATSGNGRKSSSGAKKSTAKKSTAKKTTTGSSSAKSSSQKKNTQSEQEFAYKLELILLGVIALLIFIFLCMVKVISGSAHGVNNLGDYIRLFFTGVFGISAFYLPIAAIAGIVLFYFFEKDKGFYLRFAAVLILMLVFGIFAHLFTFGDLETYLGTKGWGKVFYDAHAGGGWLFGSITMLFMSLIGRVGCVFVGVILTLVALGIFVVPYIPSIIEYAQNRETDDEDDDYDDEDDESQYRGKQMRLKDLVRKKEPYEPEPEPVPVSKNRHTSVDHDLAKLQKKKEEEELRRPIRQREEEEEEPEQKGLHLMNSSVPVFKKRPAEETGTVKTPEVKRPETKNIHTIDLPNDSNGESDDWIRPVNRYEEKPDTAPMPVIKATPAPAVTVKEEAPAIPAEGPVIGDAPAPQPVHLRSRDNAGLTKNLSDFDTPANAKSAGKSAAKYKLPYVELLNKSDRKGKRDDRKSLEETARRLEETLETFGVKVHVTDYSKGPAVTRYELQPEMGVKVSKIVSLADDIKLNLAAADIRIEAPIPGKQAVGIEVPNEESSAVSLRELFESTEFKEFKSNITFAVGKDIAGQVVVTDLAKMPHMLIAGATGSGKSVCINTLIMSILFKANPDDVKLIMVDPKVVELSVYNGIPHLLMPVVTDPKQASAALQWGVAEMTERYKKFADQGVRDLKGYNEKALSQGSDTPEEDRIYKMPQIVIIVDELADLMMVAGKEVEESICRLAQLARAAGIHLIIATQRPSVDVITGLIKANMPSRIAFSVSSGIDSRTILDSNGAEKLLGKGDMLFFPQWLNKPSRVQGAFVSDEEVSNVIDFIKNQNICSSYLSEIPTVVSSSVSGGTAAAAPADDKDEYFAEAGRFVIDKQKGSIGMLQRIFKIGFNRAARIMDQLEEAGVVGPEEGTKPRRILMDAAQFEEYLQSM